MADQEGRGPGVRGFFVVAGLALLGAIFVWLLYGLTRGRMHAPPPETRPPPAGRR